MDIKAEDKEMMEQTEQEAMEKIPPEIMEMITGGADDGSEEKPDKPAGPPYVCKICGASFRSITAIACHMSGVHK